jgi:hypothetical protein
VPAPSLYIARAGLCLTEKNRGQFAPGQSRISLIAPNYDVRRISPSWSASPSESAEYLDFRSAFRFAAGASLHRRYGNLAIFKRMDAAEDREASPPHERLRAPSYQGDVRGPDASLEPPIPIFIAHGLR